MKKNILLLILLSSFLGYSQTNTDNFSKPFIEVIGTAEKEISPDIIVVAITLSEKSNGNKKYTIAEQETKLSEILQRLSIDKKKLTLSNLDSEILTRKRKETGFEQKKEFNLTLSNSNQVSNLFEELFIANIKEASIIRLDNTKIDEYRKEVRIAALQAAKQKAEYLLESIGEAIDKPLEIKEYNNNINIRAYANAYLAESDSNDLSDIEFKKIKIVFSYNVKYGIK